MYKFLIVFSIISLFSSNHIIAQPNTRHIESGLHYGTNFETVGYVDDSNSQLNNTRIIFKTSESDNINLGLSYRIVTKNNWYHSYGISRISLRNGEQSIIVQSDTNIQAPTEGQTKLDANLSLRAEYGKYFVQEQWRKVVFGLGVAVDPSIHYSKVTPFTSDDFPARLFRVQLRMALIPQVNFRLHQRLGLQVKLPINSLAVRMESINIENAALSLASRNNNQFRSDFNPRNFGCYVGLSYKL